MPTVDIKRDLLFKAIGKEYSKFVCFLSSLAHVLQTTYAWRPVNQLTYNLDEFLFVIQLMKSLKNYALILVLNWMKW